MTNTQRVMVSNPESSWYGKIGRVERTVHAPWCTANVTCNATVYVTMEGDHRTVPFGLREVVIAPPARRHR